MSNVADNGVWHVERTLTPTGDRMEVVAADGSRRVLTSIVAPAQLGRPALDGDRVVFHKAGLLGSKLLEINIRTGEVRTLRSTVRGVLLNPVLSGATLLYVHSSFERQELKLGTRGGRRDGKRDKTVFSMVPTARRDAAHEPGHHRHNEGYKNGFGRRLPARPKPGVVETLWEPAFAAGGATVTRLHHRPDGGIDTAVLTVTI
ncbi:MAG TPA: hypothetical protein VNT22_09815 [Baekduia sp.]|nr:hypothetical protein [Baekduia sp.]